MSDLAIALEDLAAGIQLDPEQQRLVDLYADYLSTDAL